jgi:hypothetical protein
MAFVEKKKVRWDGGREGARQVRKITKKEAKTG